MTNARHFKNINRSGLANVILIMEKIGFNLIITHHGSPYSILHH